MGKKAPVNYPIGTPGQPWQDAEKAQWLQSRRVHRSYTKDVVEPLLSWASNSTAFELKKYGLLDVAEGQGLPLYAVVPSKPSNSKPWMLVTGGTHGYETSGVLGALRFLFTKAEKYLPQMNVVVAPCLCPWGYERIERWVSTAVDPNRSFRRPFDEAEIDMTVRTRETMMVMKFLDSIGAEDASVQWQCHLDLHETTDTDSSEFCPAKAARDGELEYDAHIPDGFYLVGDTIDSQLDWYKYMIAAVEKVTHIAPADEDNTLIGEPVVSPGVLLVPKKNLGLCAGGAVPDAKFIVTTEVYPDSARTNPEECIVAQVETVCAAFDYILDKKLNVTIRTATEDDLAALKEFHVANHLEETCHYPGEQGRQICELQDDYPHFNCTESFKRGQFWVATDGDEIIGSIGLLPDQNEPGAITWLNTFSVAKSQRGKRIGFKLFATAMAAVQTQCVRLVTLGGHSKGIDVMGPARKMYEKNEFVLYQSNTMSYGDDTTIDVMYYEKKMNW
ncbi:hypothetical protein ACHAWO_010048 [Cyclotella atomus]|uniref:N-acetyltransferase domain-containing protein n=1 Tax=Cyclotella atomus TaxID=382360 RepID=A0ABD3P251_9STRA